MQHQFNQQNSELLLAKAKGLQTNNQISVLKKVFIVIIALTLIAYGIFSDQKKRKQNQAKATISQPIKLEQLYALDNNNTVNNTAVKLERKEPQRALLSKLKQKIYSVNNLDNNTNSDSTTEVDNKLDKDKFGSKKHIKIEKVKLVHSFTKRFKDKQELSPVEESENWQKITVSSGDSISKIFKNLKLPATELHNLMASSKDAIHLERLKPGQQIDFLIEEQPDAEFNNLKSVKLLINPIKTLQINSFEQGYKFNVLTKEIETTHQYKQATITDSLFQSGRRAGIHQKLLLQLVDIFSWDIDFALDIRENDVFSILYEEQYANGKKISTGDIVAAEFINNGNVYRAILQKDKFGTKRYYSPDGYSMQKAFIRTPVQFTRISSKFSTGRYHPVLHKIRRHRGVDYAAPIGTPIKASGNGKVEFIGTKGGYGKCIVLKHGRIYTTLYGHLSKFAKLKQGDKVRQGQVIGYVGKTGLASGPHLHYEFRVNGVHKDPLKVQLPKSHPIPKQELNQFKLEAAKMIDLIEVHKKSYLASSE